ncbi:MAG: hypothetical protein ACMXX9_01785 [Candidatus Woesearchaeota archaeon]
MEKFQELIQQAKKKIIIADHMLNSSYKLVGDPKILLSVSTSLYVAVEAAMSSALEYERLFKRVPIFSDNFNSKYATFRNKLAPKHDIKKEDLLLIKELNEIYEAHKKSPVEFTRKDKFVIASDTYELKTLEFSDIKTYLRRAKVFIEEMDKFTSRNDRIFR